MKCTPNPGLQQNVEPKSTKIEIAKTNPITHTDHDLHEALREVWDLFDSFMLKPLLLRETAKSIKDGYLNVDTIRVGLHEKNLDRNTRSIIFTRLRKYLDKGISKTMVYEPDDERLISYDFLGVPIEITIITRKYAFFKYPEPITYNFDDYFVANPFDKYVKAMYIVK